MRKKYEKNEENKSWIFFGWSSAKKVVQQHSIKTLHDNWNPLKFACDSPDSPTYGVFLNLFTYLLTKTELLGRRLKTLTDVSPDHVTTRERPHRVGHGTRQLFEKVLSCQVAVFGHLARRCIISAAAPALRDDESKYDGAVVQVTVTSQTAGLPACHGMRDMPSGRLPSVRQSLLALWKLACQLPRKL